MPLLRTSAYWWHFISSRVLSSPLYVFSLLRKLSLRRALSRSTTTPKDAPQKSRRKVLQELPAELLTEIMKNLEWSDLLHLRQTCKRINAASYERAIWLGLLQHSIDTIEPRTCWPDRPLAFHNTGELESAVLRRHKVASIWSKPDTSPSLHRKIFAPNRKIRCSHLVPGGRWFLVGNTLGEILYFDLDDPEARPRVLIPSQYTLPSDVLPHISVDMENDGPFLSFNIAVQVQCYETDHLDLNRVINIWRVTTEVDSHGRVVDLTAANVASLAEEIGSNITRVSIHGKRLTYSISHPDTRQIFTCIVNWQMAKETSHSYQRQIIGTHFDWVSFLPNNWVLCNRDAYLRLYHLSDIPETSLSISLYVSPDVAPRRRFATFSGHFSDAFTVHDTERFVFATAEGVKGIIFPHQNPINADIMILCPDVYAKGCQLGYNYAPSFSGNPNLSILYYTWPDAGKTCVKVQKNYIRDTGSQRIHLDEGSGRLVISGQSKWEYDIIEF